MISVLRKSNRIRKSNCLWGFSFCVHGARHLNNSALWNWKPFNVSTVEIKVFIFFLLREVKVIVILKCRQHQGRHGSHLLSEKSLGIIFLPEERQYLTLIISTVLEMLGPD